MTQTRHNNQMVKVANHSGETREITLAAADENVLAAEGWHIVTNPPLQPASQNSEKKSKVDPLI